MQNFNYEKKPTSEINVNNNGMVHRV